MISLCRLNTRPAYPVRCGLEYQRSYDTEDDVLGHQASGTLWSGAEAAGNTVRDFGEFQQFLTKPSGANWQNLYCDSKNMAATGQALADSDQWPDWKPGTPFKAKRDAERPQKN